MSDKFAMGSLGIGPFSGMLDSMEFVKQAWSTLSLPNNLTPTMDLEEIDRRIADLKVVEQWLTMNLGMLRSSIQGMEIQRGTIAAIRAFGEAMASPVEGGEASTRTQGAEARAQPQAPERARDEAAPASAQAGQGAPESASPQEPESLADEISKAAVAAVNPAAWWKLLQTQFGQIAQAALSGAAQQAAAGPASTRGSAAPASASRSAADEGDGTVPKATEGARGARKGQPRKASAKTGAGAGKRAGGARARSKGREPSQGGRPAKG